MWQTWLIISGLFLVLEIITTGFLVFWFSIGALIAMIVSFFIKDIIIQTTVFIISSTILLFVTKKFVTKFTRNDEAVKTNAFSIENKTGIVTLTIDPTEAKGQVKINGETWSAKSFDGTVIPQDTKVIVLSLEGVKAIVKPL